MIFGVLTVTVGYQRERLVLTTLQLFDQERENLWNQPKPLYISPQKYCFETTVVPITLKSFPSEIRDKTAQMQGNAENSDPLNQC